jgi:hypothetical protein
MRRASWAAVSNEPCSDATEPKPQDSLRDVNWQAVLFLIAAIIAFTTLFTLCLRNMCSSTDHEALPVRWLEQAVLQRIIGLEGHASPQLD